MIQNRFYLRDHKKPIYLRRKFSHNSSLQYKESIDEHFYSSKNFNEENLFSLEELGKKNIFAKELINKIYIYI